MVLPLIVILEIEGCYIGRSNIAQNEEEAHNPYSTYILSSDPQTFKCSIFPFLFGLNLLSIHHVVAKEEKEAREGVKYYYALYCFFLLPTPIIVCSLD